MSVNYCKNHSHREIYPVCPGCQADEIAALKQENEQLKTRLLLFKCTDCELKQENERLWKNYKDAVDNGDKIMAELGIAITKCVELKQENEQLKKQILKGGGDEK